MRLTLRILGVLVLEVDLSAQPAVPQPPDPNTACMQLSADETLPMVDYTIERLRTRRIAVGLTRRALADLAGIAESTIRNIERRRHTATADTIRRLCAVPALRLRPPAVPNCDDGTDGHG